jgi:hypothetical protein
MINQSTLKIVGLAVGVALFSTLGGIASGELKAAETEGGRSDRITRNATPHQVVFPGDRDRAIAQGQTVQCVVADPTAEPLNVRDFPSSADNSSVIHTFSDGTAVLMLAETFDGQWAFVQTRSFWGWVWRDYISC